MRYFIIILALLLAGCDPVVSPPVSNAPYITVTAPVTVDPGAVQFTFPPGSIVVNVQIGSDKTPLVNVSVNGHVFSTAKTASQPATMPATKLWAIIDAGPGLIAVNTNSRVKLLSVVEAEDEEQAFEIWYNRDTAIPQPPKLDLGYYLDRMTTRDGVFEAIGRGIVEAGP